MTGSESLGAIYIFSYYGSGVYLGVLLLFGGEKVNCSLFWTTGSAYEGHSIGALVVSFSFYTLTTTFIFYLLFAD
jgi:hypothetical protein